MDQHLDAWLDNCLKDSNSLLTSSSEILDSSYSAITAAAAAAAGAASHINTNHFNYNPVIRNNITAQPTTAATAAASMKNTQGFPDLNSYKVRLLFFIYPIY